MNNKQKTGLVGTLIIGVGLFMPSVNILPMMGINANFMEMHEAPGFIMIGLVLSSAALVLWNRTNLLFIVGLASLGTIGYTFFTFSAKMDRQLSAMFGNNSMFEGVMSNTNVDWGYGWWVLVAGSVVLLTTFES